MGNLWDDLSSKALSIREKKKTAIIYNTINICMWNMMLQCLITTQKTAIRIQHYIHVGKFVNCFQSNYYLHIFFNSNTNYAMLLLWQFVIFWYHYNIIWWFFGCRCYWFLLWFITQMWNFANVSHHILRLPWKCDIINYVKK